MEYYSAIKKNEITPFAAAWMDLEIIILSEESKSERNRNIVWHPLYVESTKKWYKWTYEIDLKNKLMFISFSMFSFIQFNTKCVHLR